MSPNMFFILLSAILFAISIGLALLALGFFNNWQSEVAENKQLRTELQKIELEKLLEMVRSLGRDAEKLKTDLSEEDHKNISREIFEEDLRKKNG